MHVVSPLKMPLVGIEYSTTGNNNKISNLQAALDWVAVGIGETSY